MTGKLFTERLYLSSLGVDMGSLKRKLVAALLVVSIVLSLTASTLVYRGLYSEARQSVVSLENSLQEARESLTAMERERDNAINTIINTQREVSRVDSVVVSVEKEIDKHINDKNKRREGDAKVEVVVFEYIGDELDSLLTRGYNEIYLQDDPK